MTADLWLPEAGDSKAAQRIGAVPYYDCGDVFTTEHICPTHPTAQLTQVNFIFCKLFLKKSDYFKVTLKEIE